MTYVIFGLIAFLIIALFLIDRHMYKQDSKLSRSIFDLELKIFREFSESDNEKINAMRSVIERQDALIAALWQKTFGFYDGGPYDDRELVQYLGLKPEWHPHQREWAGPVVYLVRYEPYPWGTHAEHLNFSE